jgi:hypothetical protein
LEEIKMSGDITSKIRFIDDLKCEAFFTCHEHGKGLSISTHRPNRPGPIVTMVREDAIKLRDWLNREFPDA